MFIFLLSFCLLSSSLIATASPVPKKDDSDDYYDPDSEEVEVETFQVAQFDWPHVKGPFIIALWILLACTAKIVFHLSKTVTSIFPDSSLLILLGLLVGILMWETIKNDTVSLGHDAFFLYLLPPIVFDAGYFMPSRQFFDNIGTILTFAIIGTIWNAATIGLSLWVIGLTGVFTIDVPFTHAMLYSSLISATDPVAVLAVFDEIHVNEILYIVVFGEALLNDAVGVVLYDVFGTFADIAKTGPITSTDIVNGFLAFFVVGLGGVGIGLVWATLTSLVTRFTENVRVLEPLFVFVMAYCSYLTGEMFHLSSILAIVFCGMAMKQYVEGNISHKSQTTVKYFLKMLSMCSETIIFMFLGLSTVSANQHWDTGFVCLTVLFCLMYRSIGVVFLTKILNKFRLHKLEIVDQFILSYGGLRGAMVYGLVSSINGDTVQAKKMFVTTTIVVIYFSVFVQGMTIKPLVNFLKVKRADLREVAMQEEIMNHVMDHTTAGIEQIIGLKGHNRFRNMYENFNTKYIKPVLMRQAPKTLDTGIVEAFTKINVREAMDHLARYGSYHSSSAVNSLTTVMRKYQGFNSNANWDEFDKRSSLMGGRPMLDMKVFDVRPGRKHVSAIRRQHTNLVNKAARVKPKGTVEKVVAAENGSKFADHNAQPYKVQNLVTKNKRKHKQLEYEKGKKPSKKGVRFNDEDEVDTMNVTSEETKPISAPLLKQILFSEGESPETEYELTAAERVLPWLRDSATLEFGETVLQYEGDDDMMTLAESSLPWNEPTPPSPNAFDFIDDHPHSFFAEEVVDNLTAVERELPWRRIVDSESLASNPPNVDSDVDSVDSSEADDKF